ncbi:EamA family transporter [Halobacillus litoralis]|uniref:DMT family transporter n=1 Tax=Halobacillus litoralis TaxID=45668 RepID=UPI001CD5D5B1|nr:EamA family transporter [Halobacillus litoralis]MCA0971986.1 EamA family transporter [Halobacillus litoralis]
MNKYTALIGLSFIWGLSFVFIKYLVEPAGVWGTVFLRCSAGALVLVPFVWKKREEMKNGLPWKALLLVGIFNAGVPWGLIALSETQINSSTAAVLNALTPICTALIGFAFFSVVLKKQQWAGVLLGFVGVLAIIDFQVGALFTNNLVGIGTMVAATVCYGFASQYTKRHLQHTGILVVATATLLVGAGVGLLGMLVSGNGLSSALITDPYAVISVVGLGCLGSGVAHLLFFYMVKEGSAEFATSVTYLIPLTAMVWGYVLLDEPVSGHLISGLLLIFIGVFLATRGKKAFAPVGKARKVS